MVQYGYEHSPDKNILREANMISGKDAIPKTKNWATKKTRTYFPWNPGCLLGILRMVYYNPYITG